MNREKLKEIQLSGSIHTFEIRYKDARNNTIYADNHEAIKKCYEYKEKHGYERIVFDLNRVREDKTFSGFCQTLNKVFSELKIKPNTWEFSRIDFRMDSYVDGFYQKYLKLFNYILMLFMTMFNFRCNDYVSYGLIRRFQKDATVRATSNITLPVTTNGKTELKTVRNKDSSVEINYYDRKQKTKDVGNVYDDKTTARLEIRSKSDCLKKLRSKDSNMSELDILNQEFAVNWVTRFQNALLRSDYLTTSVLNNALIDEWQYYKECRKNGQIFYSHYLDFLIANQDRIINKSQFVNLIDSLRHIENVVRKSTDDAEYIHTKCGIEFFSKQELKQIVNIITDTISRFFESPD